MTLEEKLIRLRKKEGLSQEVLAEKLGVSRQAVSRWEAGETTPDLINLLGLCTVFSVSADYLIHDDYADESDIPMVRRANEAVSRRDRKLCQWHFRMMIAGVAFALLGLLAALLSGSAWCLPCCALGLVVAAVQGYRYLSFKKSLFLNSASNG